MAHPDIRTLLRQAAGRLSAEELRGMDGHLAGCRECAARVRALRALREDWSTGREPVPLVELIRQARRLGLHRKGGGWRGRLLEFLREKSAAALDPWQGLFAVLTARPAVVAVSALLLGLGVLLLWPQPSPRILVRLLDTSGTVALTDHRSVVGLRRDGLPTWCRACVSELLSAGAASAAPSVAGIRDELQTASAVLSGSSRQKTRPILLSPAGSVVRSVMPSFRWEGVIGTTNYQLLVSRAGVLLADIPVGVLTNFSWSAAQPVFRPGETYAWQVEAGMPGRTSISIPARFYVLSVKKLSELEGLEKLCRGSAVTLLALHEAWGLWDEAAQDWAEVRRLNPGNDAVSRIGSELAQHRGGGARVPSNEGDSPL